MDADHDDIVHLAVSPQRVAAEGLSDVAVSLANGDQVIELGAEGVVVQVIGVVDKEEVLPVEGFADMLSLENDDHDIVLWVALPL